ncbi:MAG TPA: hypothetical protein VMF90_15400 [Rhizobiaceae bacterium]|nr:hypothetical protein [Rhizobiaceae bacterium]
MLRLLFALVCLLGALQIAFADPIDIEVRILKQDGSPYAGLPVRLVVGSEPDSRAPNAGEVLTTDADGKIRRKVDAPVVDRKVSLGNPFVKRSSKYVAVAVELELVDRRALYWTDLDYLKDGVLGQMVAYVAGPDGVLDDMLTFHADQHAWSFPDKPDGMLMTSYGADLKVFSMEKTADGAGWIVKLEIVKQEFTVR